MHINCEFFALGTTFICSLRLRLGQVVWSRFNLHCFLLLYVFLFHLLDILEYVVLNCILLMVPHLIHKCTHLLSYINLWFRCVQDLGALSCRSHSEEYSKLEPMMDDRVIDIIKGHGLEGPLRTPSREIDHGLITALVERWQPKTHTFLMPHGEVTIKLQDVKVLLGHPVDGEAITRSTQKVWQDVCRDFLGFVPINDNTKQLTSQRIVIKRLLEQVAGPLPPNAEEDQLHKYG